MVRAPSPVSGSAVGSAAVAAFTSRAEEWERPAVCLRSAHGLRSRCARLCHTRAGGAGGELRASGWRTNTRLKLDTGVSSPGCGLYSQPLRPQQPWVPGPSERWCCGQKVGSAGRPVPKPAQDAQAAGRAAAGPAGPVLRPLGAAWWPLELLVCFSQEVSPQC